MRTKTLLNGCICLIAVLGMVTMAACSDEEENNDPFAEKLVSGVEALDSEGDLSWTRTFGYDAKGRMIKTGIDEGFAEYDYTFIYSYIDDTHLTITLPEEEGETINYVLKDGHPVSMESDDETFLFDYDGAFLKSIHTEYEYDGSRETEHYDYTWSGGDIIKAVYTYDRVLSSTTPAKKEVTTATYEYSGKENVMNCNLFGIYFLYPGEETFTLTLGTEMTNSKHLPSSMRMVEADGNIITATFFDYEFDSEGYPIRVNCNYKDGEEEEKTVWKIKY